MLYKNIRWTQITSPADNSGQYPTHKVSYLEKNADTVIVFPYGFYANVPPATAALMFHVGDSADKAAISLSHDSLPNLKENEVAFFHPASGAQMIWDVDGNLEIKTGNGGKGKVYITADEIIHNGYDIGLSHRHSQGNDSDGDAEQDIDGVL